MRFDYYIMSGQKIPYSNLILCGVRTRIYIFSPYVFREFLKEQLLVMENRAYIRFYRSSVTFLSFGA